MKCIPNPEFWILGIRDFIFSVSLSKLIHDMFSLSKKFVPWFFQISRFFDFNGGLRETARSYNLQLKLHIMIYERRPNVLTLFSRFYDLAVSRNPPSKSENRKIWKNHGTNFFLIMRVRVIRQIFQLQFMVGKQRPDLLTLPTKFYDLTVSRNLFSKAEIRQFETNICG